MRKTTIAMIFACLALASCDEDGGQTNLASPAQVGGSSQMAMSSEVGKSSAERAGGDAESSLQAADNEEARYLAYTHRTEIQTSQEAVSSMIDGITSFCTGLSGCLVVNSSIRDWENHANGSFQARATPDAVADLNSWLSENDAGGEITHRSTSAEDMAGAIMDTQRRLAMLYRHRDQLEELHQRAGSSIESLIRISEQLASVQSNIEAAEGRQRSLEEKVQREIWILEARSRPSAASNLSHVWSALEDAPGTLARGTAMLIVVASYVIPWALVSLLVVMSLLRVRRWRRARKSRGPSATTV